MTDLWFNFAVLIIVQLLVFLIHAYYEKKLTDVPRVLWQGASSGLVFGLPADLIGGQYFGLGTYLFGFSPLFLISLAILGWGLGAANVLLMQRARFLHFCTWMMFVIVISEIINLFFPLWTFPFAYASLEYVLVALLSPLVWAIGVALAWHVLFKYRFVFLEMIF